jgi:hypothetical protein
MLAGYLRSERLFSLASSFPYFIHASCSFPTRTTQILMTSILVYDTD